MALRLMTTREHNVGMASRNARSGVAICILYGCSVPVLMRSVRDGYMLVGECYLDGYMYGEILNEPRETEYFRLIWL
ncbi:hypothetical protein GGR56DRAFT_245695 [Xylariaceae sp. FL0804]|nr:hypothetical protein GGR56DRAFT_245695 [Xylariaceae sp. FL0804]